MLNILFFMRIVYGKSSLKNHVFFSRATEGGLAPDAAAGAGAGTDGIVGGPRTPQQIASQKRLQATQAQVDEVVDIMKTNVEKVLERDQKLSELDDRAGEAFMIINISRERKRISSDRRSRLLKVSLQVSSTINLLNLFRRIIAVFYFAIVYILCSVVYCPLLIYAH